MGIVLIMDAHLRIILSGMKAGTRGRHMYHLWDERSECWWEQEWFPALDNNAVFALKGVMDDPLGIYTVAT